MPSFSERSKKNLLNAHEDLQKICNEAIKIVDFSVLDTYRDKEKQDYLFNSGLSKLQWPNSKHNKMPSLAVDVVPYPIDWNDKERFYFLAGIFKAIAFKHGIILRFGGDWDNDNDFKDQTFLDLGHYELC